MASCALFIAVRRLYDPTTAALATLIFMTFPAHLIYSGMAMAELTLLAACMLCFAVFVYVPRRWKPYAGPLLLLLPVAFRETGAILVLPMAAVLVAQSSGTRARDAVIMLLLSLAVVAFEVGVLFGGRPSLLTANVFGGSFAAKYGDAFFQEQLSPSAHDWMIAISKNLARNFDALLMIDDRPLVETGSLWFLFAAIPVGAALAFRNRDLLMCSFSAVAGVLAIVLMALYAIPAFKGVRFMLIAQPFAAVVLSRLLLGMLGREQQRKLLITALLAGTLVGSMGVWSAFRDQ